MPTFKLGVKPHIRCENEAFTESKTNNCNLDTEGEGKGIGLGRPGSHWEGGSDTMRESRNLLAALIVIVDLRSRVYPHNIVVFILIFTIFILIIRASIMCHLLVV